MKKIILFSHDPGGTNTVVPLIKLLQRDFKVVLFGKGISLERYKLWGYSGQDIMDHINEVNIPEIKRFLLHEHPDCIITGTSSNDITEKFMWSAAKSLNIPSFAIIDHWTNYGIRFSKYGVSELKKYDESPSHDFQPDRIFVIDDYVKTEMKAIGFDQTKIIITGQPYFDLLNKYKNIFTGSNITNFKRQNKIPEADKLVVFASEPLEKEYKENNKMEYLGYTEKTIIESLLCELDNVVTNNNINLTLVIKSHPKENTDDFDKYVCNKKYHFKIMVLDRCNNWDLIMASDLVCGMSSMLLIESVILNKPAISIKIGSKKNDSFILSQKGILKTIFRKIELKNILNNFLVSNIITKYNFRVIKNASGKIVNYINKYLCQY